LSRVMETKWPRSNFSVNYFADGSVAAAKLYRDISLPVKWIILVPSYQLRSTSLTTTFLFRFSQLKDEISLIAGDDCSSSILLARIFTVLLWLN